jgi:hypothetical protein
MQSVPQESTPAGAKGHPGRATKWFARLLVAAVMGALLPALVAAPAQAGSCPTPSTDPNGRPLPAGSYVCDYVPTYRLYDSRGHVFVVGTDSANSIHHTWQTSPTGPYTGWVNLGGTGRSSVGTHLYNNSSGGKAIEIWVVGLGNVKYCKNYNGNVGGAWWPGQTAWTSNASSCRSF